MRNPKRPSGRSQGLWCAQWWSNISGRRRERTVGGGREGGREGEDCGWREEGRKGGRDTLEYIYFDTCAVLKKCNTIQYNDRDG